ncbi:MAG: amidohydrolase family protein [Tissierellia bacterium]|nr:amidohydrolase family protein [Tissierellia bacterium]
MDPGQTIFAVYEFAKEYLKAGYTTIRDCGSPHNSAVAVRDAIKAEIIDGPRIITSGLIITPTETGNKSYENLYHEADGAEEIRKAVRHELKLENDFIKLMVTGAFLNERGEPGLQIMTFEELKVAVESARIKETYVCAHCHSAEGIKSAIRAGARTIEHAVFIDEEAIEMLKNSTETYIVATGAITLDCLKEDNTTISANALEKSKLYEQKEKECIHNAYKAGLKIGFGSDLNLVSFKETPGYEFIARKDYYGFEDKDILLQATKYSAEIAGLDHITGTVKVGKYADLIVVDGNPDEDIYTMKKPILNVFKEGKQII